MEAAANVEAMLLLSCDERLRLIEILWTSLVEEVGDRLELSPEIEAELDRRLEEHRLHPEDKHTWAEVEARIRGRR